jgi:hypothetical protein
MKFFDSFFDEDSGNTREEGIKELEDFLEEERKVYKANCERLKKDLEDIKTEYFRRKAAVEQSKENIEENIEENHKLIEKGKGKLEEDQFKVPKKPVEKGKGKLEEDQQLIEEDKVKLEEYQFKVPKKPIEKDKVKLEEDQFKVPKKPIEKGKEKLEEDQKPIEKGKEKLEEDQKPIEKGKEKLEEDQKPIEKGKEKLEEDQQLIKNINTFLPIIPKYISIFYNILLTIFTLCISLKLIDLDLNYLIFHLPNVTIPAIITSMF